MKRHLIFLIFISILTLVSLACSQALAFDQTEEGGQAGESDVVLAATPIIEGIVAPAGEIGGSQPAANLGAISAEAEPTSTAMPAELVVTNVHGYQDTDSFFNYYHIVGNVYNGTDTAVTNVELSLTVKDAGGKSLLRDDSDNPVDSLIINPLLWTIGPGQSAPFSYALSMENGKPETYQATVANHVPTDARNATLAVQHDQMVKGDDGTIYLTGELVNLGETAVELNSLAGAALDEENRVVAANSYATGAWHLAPAGDIYGYDRTPFRISLIGPAPTARTWAVYMDASPVRAVELPELEFSSPSIYVDAEGDIHMIGSMTNKSHQTLEVDVLAGLYDAAGLVLDADSAYLPYALLPGQSIPYHFNSFRGVDDVLRQGNKVARAKVWVASALPNSYEHVTLTTSNDKQEQIGGAWHFSGEVINTSAKNLNWATVVVAIYDTQGQLLATAETDIYGETGLIEPQSKTPYEIDLSLPAEIDPAKMILKIYVQGLVD